MKRSGPPKRTVGLKRSAGPARSGIDRSVRGRAPQAKGSYRECAGCGTEFWVAPCETAKRFCTQTCYDTARAATVTLTCPVCEKPFTRAASQARLRGMRWCSMACRDVGAPRPMKPCRHCGVPFTPHNVVRNLSGVSGFCERSCFYAWKSEQERKTVKQTCPICSTLFERPRAWGKAVYCSRECHGIGRRREGTLNPGFRGPGWRRIAAAIRERDGRECVRCGDKWAEGDRLFPVDHVVPWRLVMADPTVANHETNLATLCHSCHGVKTSAIEPRMLRGDWMALEDFYGEERSVLAMATTGIRA